jgi:hypothetical protein
MKVRALLPALALVLLASAARAQELLDSYDAFLSWNDHHNSQGERLTQPWQIIRQDRANFHRFGRADPQDGWDSFFVSQENREIAEQMLAEGQMDLSVADAIVGGEVMVHVEIWGSGGVGDYISVTVN